MRRIRQTGGMSRHITPYLPVVVLIGLAMLAVAGCATTAASPTPAESTTAVEPDHVFELEMTSDLRILRDGQQVTSLPVNEGETYTFRINNTAGLDHDFYIGPEADLASGATDGLAGIPPWNAGVREFQTTIETPGPLAFGCTVPGHYALMHGAFEISPGASSAP